MPSPKLTRYLIALLHVLIGVSVVIAVLTVVWWLATDLGPEVIVTVIFTLLVPALLWGAGKLKRHAESDDTALPAQPAKPAPQTDRDILLNKVHDFWIKGVLDRTLVQGEWFDLDANLGTVPQPAAARELQADTGPATTLHTGEQIAALFKREGPALLILGEPGSGKTTTLLEVAQALLQEARENPALPVPVVMNLASWAEKRPARLEDWLIERLNRDYGVSSKLAERWIADDKLNFLLDGLDEVPHNDNEEDGEGSARAACAKAINAFWQPRQNRADMLLVVCSRTAEYTQLDTTLTHNSALHLKPLALAQAATYLYNLGRDWDDLRAALPEHPLLREFSASPLMVNIMAVAYQHVPIEQITRHTEAAALRAHLFEHYTTRCLNTDPGAAATPPYTNAQTRHYLAWLARKMTAHDVIVFQIEGLQPEWSDTEDQRKRYRWITSIITMLAFGLGVGLVFGLGVGLIFERGVGLVVGLVFGLSGTLISALSVWKPLEIITPVDRLNWSWHAVRKNLANELVNGLVSGLVVALVFRLEEYIGLIGGLVVALAVALFGGLNTATITQRTRPNQGIWRSVINWLIIGLSTGLVIGLGVGLVVGMGAGRAYGLVFELDAELDAKLVVGLIFGLIYGLVSGLIVALISMLVVGLDYGGTAVIQHTTLRAILWRAQVAPLNYAEFLRYTSERHLTRQVGGGFIFRHRLLMDHFAQAENT